MVVLIRGFGNHSNHLFQTIHLEAFCLENSIPFHNPGFLKMAKFYNKKSFPIGFVLPTMLWGLAKLRIIQVAHLTDIGKTDTYKTLFINKKCLFVDGWVFRVPELTKKYQDFFIMRYSLKREYYAQNESVIEFAKIRSGQSILVAVHIRRGDYKEWMKGKYYFDDRVYLNYMKTVEEQLHREYSRNIKFFIFSNTNIEIAPSENYILEHNAWFIDQYLMSKCDYIIGPPSTFSLWASYIGKTKYFHISNDSGDITLPEFNYCHG